MEIFIFCLRILALDLVPVAFVAGIHILFKKVNFFKKLNYWWKQALVGLIFSALCILSYLASVPIDVLGHTSYVSNGTVLPILVCLVFGWPSGCAVGVVGAIFRATAFNDFLRWSVVVSLILSAAIGSLARIFLYKDRRTKWYNAALTGIFVETINFLFIFIFSRDVSDAYDILSVIDVFCILGSAVTCSLSIIFINLLDKKILKIRNYDSKNISHSIATKIQHRLFIVTFATLIVVSTSTHLITSKKAKDDIQDQLILSSSNAKARFDLRFAVNTYQQHSKSEYLYEYRTLCVGQKILGKGYPIIVSNNENDINDAEKEPYKKGEIISTNQVIADRSQYPHEKFKFDDGTTAVGRSESEYSSDLNVNLLKVKVNKIKYYAAIFPTQVYSGLGTKENLDVYIVCLANAEEVDANIGISVKIAIYTQILAFLFLFAIINLLLRKIVIAKIYQVNDSLEKITNGDLNEVVKAKGSKEIERLSNRINMTVDSLKLYAKKVEQKIEEDLILAKKIQTTSVPTLFPVVNHYEIYATMHTAKEVGGDFYDYVTIDDDHVLFLVADVSGKGIPAALFMMRAKTLIKSLVSTGIPLETVVKRANDELCHENTAGLFVTMWIGILNTPTGEVTYVNCGHCMPIARLDGGYSYINARHNFVLGAVEGFEFKSDSIKLQPDDMLLLYTDGVTEATNKKLELYGEDRLIKFIRNSQNVFDCHQLLEILNDEIDRYQKDVEQADDITILGLKYLGNENNAESKQITLRSKSSDTTAAINFVKTFMYKNRASELSIKEMISAMDEVYTNIVKYAYPKRIGYVKIKVALDERILRVTITDKGIEFDPSKGKDKNNKDGLGLLIIKKCVNKMFYSRNKNENILILEKNI